MDPYDIILYGADFQAAFRPKLPSISEAQEPPSSPKLPSQQSMQRKYTLAVVRDEMYAATGASKIVPTTPCNSLSSSCIASHFINRNVKSLGVEQSTESEEQTARSNMRRQPNLFQSSQRGHQAPSHRFPSLARSNNRDAILDRHLKALAARRTGPVVMKGYLKREISKKRAAMQKEALGRPIKIKSETAAEKDPMEDQLAEEKVVDGIPTKEKADSKKSEKREGKMQKLAKLFRFWS